MSLDRELFAMRRPINRLVWLRPMTLRYHRVVTPAKTAGDTPYSPYLREWLEHRASQHRDLLRNINAAAAIGLAPFRIGD
jgi:hypothetical protein